MDETTFLRQPSGAVVIGQRWVYGCVGSLFFSVVCGRLEEEDMAGLLRVMHAELTAPPHLSLGDASALTDVVPAAFELLGSYTHGHRRELARVIQNQVLVRPTGVTGAVVAGYYGVYPPEHPYSISATRAEALATLGLPASLLSSVDERLHRDPLLCQLRSHLAQNLGALSLARAAKLLGVSVRSLQRRLGMAGTSFVREATRARIERAVRLLVTTDKKLCTVAREVGCASLASFSEMFSREVGMPPSQYRLTHSRRAA